MTYNTYMTYIHDTSDACRIGASKPMRRRAPRRRPTRPLSPSRCRRLRHRGSGSTSGGPWTSQHRSTVSVDGLTQSTYHDSSFHCLQKVGCDCGRRRTDFGRLGIDMFRGLCRVARPAARPLHTARLFSSTAPTVEDITVRVNFIDEEV